jgi:hypothetical protein
MASVTVASTGFTGVVVTGGELVGGTLVVVNVGAADSRSGAPADERLWNSRWLESCSQLIAGVHTRTTSPNTSAYSTVDAPRAVLEWRCDFSSVDSSDASGTMLCSSADCFPN